MTTDKQKSVPRFSDRTEKRRIFRARKKLNQAGLISHITQRAPGKEKIFHEEEDYLTMLWLLKDVAFRFEIKFYAFCLLSNHVHFLLQSTQENLSQAMHSIFFRYGMRYNRKYERRGHVFGAPYRQAVCLDDSYFLTASVYIHLNPVRAGLVDKAEDYNWSSCSLYCSPTPAHQSFVTTDRVLSLINSDQDLARTRYSSFLHKGKEVEHDNVMEQETAIEKLVSRLADLFPQQFKKTKTKLTSLRPAEEVIIDQPDLEEMLKRVHDCKPRSAKTQKAKKYLIQQLLARGYKRSEIAAKFGVSRKTIYNILQL